MDKPEYELGPLRAAVTQCNINIAAFNRAIDKEKESKENMLVYIEKWKEYNKWIKENGDHA